MRQRAMPTYLKSHPSKGRRRPDTRSLDSPSHSLGTALGMTEYRSGLHLRGLAHYNRLVLTDRIEFQPERDNEIFSAIAAVPAVFLLCGEDASSEPYVSKTANLRRRLQR